MFLIPAILAFIVWLFLFSMFFSKDSDLSTGAKWGIFAGCIGVSILIGILCVCLKKVAIALIGASLGAFAFLLIYNALLFATPTYILYIGMALWGIATGILVFIIFETLIIITTSFLGSYLMVRGISHWIGGFPSEILIYELLKSGAGFEGTFYAYLAVIWVLTIGCIIFQWKVLKTH